MSSKHSVIMDKSMSIECLGVDRKVRRHVGERENNSMADRCLPTFGRFGGH